MYIFSKMMYNTFYWVIRSQERFAYEGGLDACAKVTTSPIPI